MKKLGYLNHINNNDNSLKSICSKPWSSFGTTISVLPNVEYKNLNYNCILWHRYWLRNVGPHIISIYGLPRRTNNNFMDILVDNINYNDHLTYLNKNYHIIVNQLNNNLYPTRHLKVKFLANSMRINN
ncbi:MULE domain-containing protein [Aphis craccivora]|uniref:MULE domain-containing protein n=1 Tax=Aphis craccivora TaxID=307492 RepID=A0A6G0VMX0_APHCR|nr:MULE domain-containing protein [Aphis craccivora]